MEKNKIKSIVFYYVMQNMSVLNITSVIHVERCFIYYANYFTNSGCSDVTESCESKQVMTKGEGSTVTRTEGQFFLSYSHQTFKKY